MKSRGRHCETSRSPKDILHTRRLARDKAWSAHWGGTREDIDLSRAIMGKDGGANWYANLKSAYESGAILPATFLAVMAAAQSEAQGEE